MSRYRLNEAGEWERVWPEPAEPEREPSMADYIRRAHEGHDPELAEQRHRWKMQGTPIPGGARDRAGFVYVIQDIESGLYKIGRTKNLEKRMQKLGVGKTARLISSKPVANADEVEKAAHRRYRAARLPQTEYFKLDCPPML